MLTRRLPSETVASGSGFGFKCWGAPLHPHSRKDGVSNIMIATSVAARGIDVKSVILVINFKAASETVMLYDVLSSSPSGCSTSASRSACSV